MKRQITRRQAILTIAFGATLLPQTYVQAQTAPTAIRVGATMSDEVAPIDYAIRTGMYAKAGLDVQLIPGPSGAVITAAVLSDSYQIGKSNLLSLINAHVRGLPISVVGAAGVYNAKAPLGELLVAADSPFRNGADLAGKNIAVPSLNDINVLATNLWIDQNGGDSRLVHYIEIPNSSMEPALVERRADAALLTQPALVDALASGKTRILSHAYSAIANSFVVTAWFTSSTWAGKHSDALKAFLRITSDAAAYTNSHIAETDPYIAQLTKVSVDVIRKMPHLHLDLTVRATEVQPVIEGCVKYKLIPTSFSARDLVYSEIPVR